MVMINFPMFYHLSGIMQKLLNASNTYYANAVWKNKTWKNDKNGLQTSQIITDTKTPFVEKGRGTLSATHIPCLALTELLEHLKTHRTLDEKK